MPKQDNQFSTVLEAIESATSRGFTLNFSFRDEMMVCDETGELFSHDDLTIEEFHRVEGNSDPEESAIVYLIVSKTGSKGVLIDVFGAQANSDLAEFISSIPIDRNETIQPAEKKFCLNCGAELNGKYCTACGQKDENLREPVWKLITHFTGDFFHYDSKFFRTIVLLIFKPGFLTTEYLAGKRAKYMKPIPLYIFTSVVFFLLLFIAATPSTEVITGLTTKAARPCGEFLDSIMTGMKRDSSFNILNSTKDTLLALENEDDLRIKLTSEVLPATVEAYNDSIKKLPRDKRPNFFSQYLSRKAIQANSMDTKEFIKNWLENFFHNLPKTMFFLLPIFALILKLVYIRRKVYLFEHAIFTLHYHTFMFLLFSIVLLYSLWVKTPSMLWIAFLLMLIALLVSLKRVYKQSWVKSFFKMIAILLLYSLTGGIILLIVVAISALST